MEKTERPPFVKEKDLGDTVINREVIEEIAEYLYDFLVGTVESAKLCIVVKEYSDLEADEKAVLTVAAREIIYKAKEKWR